jgi:hypothetical protein
MFVTVYLQRTASYRYSISTYNTSKVSFTLRPLYPRKEPLVPTEYDAGWAREPVWMPWSRKKSLASAGNRTLVVELVDCRYAD